jgi:hypothetical protein
MTVTAHPERQEAYDAVAHVVPDAHSIIESMMEDLALPAEYDEHGFDSTHEVAEHVEAAVIEQINDTPVHPDDDAYVFVEEELTYAKDHVFDMVMEDFEPPAE